MLLLKKNTDDKISKLRFCYFRILFALNGRRLLTNTKRRTSSQPDTQKKKPEQQKPAPKTGSKFQF